MAGIREVLQFLIEADASQAIRTFDNVEKASAKSLGKAETASQRFGAALTKGGAAAVAASATLGIGLYKLANQASNLELSQRRLSGIFGENADKMIKFSTGLNKIGLSDRDAAAAMAQIGEAARGLGLSADQAAKLTPQLIEIVTQLGYLQGMSPGEALETVNAAMRGEYDSLQRLVPAINQATINQAAMAATGKKNAQQLTNTEKTMAALQLIVSKGSATLARSGDVMDTLAGRAAVTKANLTDLGTAIGAGALPVVQQLSSWLGSLAGAFNNLPQGAQSATGRLLAFAAVGGTVAGSLSLMAGQAIRMKQQFDQLSQTMPRTANALSALGKAAGVWALIATAGAAIGSLDDNGRMSAESIDALATSLGKLGATASATDLSKILPRGISGTAADLKSTFDTLSDPSVAQNIGNTFENIASGALTFGTVETSAEKAANRIDGVDKALASLAGTNLPLAQTLFAKLSKSLQDQGVPADEIKKRFNDYNNVVAQNTEVVKANREAHTTHGLAMASAAGATINAADAIKAMNDQAQQSQGVLGASAKQADAFAAAIERTTTADDQLSAGLNIGKASADFAETAKNLPGSIDQMKLALGGYNEAQTTAISNLTALSDQTSAYLSTLVASGQTTDQVKTSANNLALAYAQQMLAAGLTQDQVQSYLQVLGLTPKQVDTAITVSKDDIAKYKLSLYQDQLDALPPDKATQILTLIDQGKFDAAWQMLHVDMAQAVEVPVKPVLQSQSVERWQSQLRYMGNVGRGAPAPAPGGRSIGMRGARGATAGYVPMPSSGMIVVNLPQGARGEEVVAALRRYEKRNGTATAGWHPL